MRSTAFFSKRTGWTLSSNRLSAAVEAKRKAGRALLDLTESNPTRCAFRFLSAGILAPLSDSGNLGYEPDPRGLLEAREAVCRYYAEKGSVVASDQVFLTASTSEAYSFLFRLLLDPGDRAAVPAPSYPLFGYLGGLNDAELSGYSVVYENGWRLDRAVFEKVLAEGARAVILVNPNNPTGNFTSEQEREFINRSCRQACASVISDEVFLDFKLEEGAHAQSFAKNGETLTFTLSGISKILGMPQMKLSWIIVSGPETERKEAIARLEVIADAYLSVNTPSQRALPFWLDQRAQVLDEIVTRLRANLGVLSRAVKGNPRARLLRSEGGWYAVLEIDTSQTDEEIALESLEKEDLLVHPGYLFDFARGNYLVVSLLLPPAVFEEGAGRLARSLFF